LQAAQFAERLARNSVCRMIGAQSEMQRTLEDKLQAKL